ncbi:MAG: TonB-dependent receptor [Phycisphaerales bacterium]|nr:TonB-dependent receptor [Phycisphaerales bacterium]
MAQQVFKKYIAFSLAIFTALPSKAQDSDSSEIPLKIPLALKGIEVRSLRTDSHSPFSKIDINKKDIAAQNLGQDLPVLLQMTPSVVSSSDAGAGIGYTALRVRGTDGTRINVTLNGVPVNDAESQGTFFVNLPDLASSTSSIQLQRGVGSSTNGAAAFGATMSISNMEQNDKAGGSLNISAGSFNTQKYTIKMGTGLLEKGWKFDVRLSKINSDGYIQRSASDLKAAQVIGSWQINEKSRLRFQVLTGAEKTGQAWNGVPQDSLQSNRRYNGLGEKADGSFYNNQTDNYQQTYYQAFIDHNFNKHWTSNFGLFLTRGKGYYEEYRLGEQFKNYGLANFTTAAGDTFTKTDMVRQLWLDNYYYGGLYGFQYAKNKTQINIGGSVSQYSGLHYGFVKWAQYGVPADHNWYRNDAMKNDFNQFVKVQYTIIPKLTLYADAQVRVVSYFMNGFRKNPSLRPSSNYIFFNPKLGANYMLQDEGNKQQRIYGSLAIANKEPNRDDFEAAPTNLPKAEKLINLEAGYEITRKGWTALANVYLMDYKNQLVLNGQINDVGAYTRINVDKSYRAGLELVASFQSTKWLNISGNVTFSQNKIKSFDEYIDDYDNGNQKVINHQNTHIAFSPNLIAAANFAFKPFLHFRYKSLQSLELNLMSKYVGRQYLDNTSDKARSISDYTLFDIRTRYILNIKGNSDLVFTFAVYNALNRSYENNGYNYSYISGGTTNVSNYYYPQAGRYFLAGIGFTF